MTPYKRAIEKFKRELVITAVRNAGGNCCDAAAALGVHRNLVGRVIKQAGTTAYKVRRMALAEKIRA